MKIHRIEQLTPEWDILRAGKITGTVAEKFITPKGNSSTQGDKEISRLVCERLGLQDPPRIKPTYWMERGLELEPEARRWFSVQTDLEVQTCGFIENDEGDAGISPDCFTIVGMEQVIPVELKVRSPAVHHQHWMAGELPDKAKPQVHFQIVICEAPYAYYMEYNPNLPPLLIKVSRDEYTDKLERCFEAYRAKLAEAWERSREYAAALEGER